eukprot:CAMPEP_0202441248 /NCGR_PEP_ID=MMETSP1360-20130828/689_1 /ASSEMBLY_ACC=CAM_ASM_000848 /TAXON_ID=515479 /ORGANISM="Licmophora paradoxa, Strain CCMP2313" /LENGTH=551 /DNA_ID=CAMNT_0049056113 /DNA_START=34 /DNA_END=1686 /DNA_ORIENTATION=-
MKDCSTSTPTHIDHDKASTPSPAAATAFTSPILQNARKHKWFLEKLHSLGVTTPKPINAKSSVGSLIRYRDYWLPLVNDNPSKKLLPPPDIAWLWHCHRLAPMEYQRYCQQTFGVPPLEANPPFTLQIDTQSEERLGEESEFPTMNEDIMETNQLWEQKYPNQPFFLLTANNDKEEDLPSLGNHEEIPSSSSPGSLLLSGFDLLGSTERQAAFLWQVSGEYFDDDSFLHDGLTNYYRFLKLRPRAAASGITLVPTYQIDLMWHTHILSSLQNYNSDCQNIMGSHLHHDDSLTDRSEGSLLNRSFMATQNLWKEAYDGAEYKVEGGMYRGEPPSEYFQHAATGLWNPALAPSIENKEWIGLLGASSTSPSFTEWAEVGGDTSDGSPAFIAASANTRAQLVRLGRKSNYVLGRTSNKSGYFHMETKEANDILYKRCQRKVQKLKSEIAFDKMCCFAKKVNTPKKEKTLAELTDAMEVLKARLSASKPNSEIKSSSKGVGASNYYSNTGVWLYPPELLTPCGGACGGVVAASAGGFVGGGEFYGAGSEFYGGGG